MGFQIIVYSYKSSVFLEVMTDCGCCVACVLLHERSFGLYFCVDFSIKMSIKKYQFLIEHKYICK